MFDRATGLFDNQSRHEVRGAATRFGFNGRPEDLAELKAAVEAAEAEIEEEKPAQVAPVSGSPASSESAGISQAEFEAVFGPPMPKAFDVYAQRRAAIPGARTEPAASVAKAPAKALPEPAAVYAKRAAARGGA